MAHPTKDAVWFAATLTEKFTAAGGHDVRLAAVGGRVYDRIMRLNEHGQESGVHAFVRRDTGAVLKPDGFRKPAPGVRYADVRSAAAAADRFGSYLYAN